MGLKSLMTGRFGKRRASDESPVMAASETDGPGARQDIGGGDWLDGQRAYDDRMMRQSIRTWNWQRAWFYQFLFSVFMLGVVVYALKIPKYIQVPIATSSLGRSVLVKDTAPDAALLAQQEYTEVGDFIENCRTVLGDKMGLRKLQARCYSRLPDESAGRRLFVDQMRGENDPFIVGETHSVEVTVISRLKLSAQTWEVEWIEQFIDLNGGRVGQPIKYRGHLEIEFIRGSNSMTQLETNPNGFYVQKLTWAKKM